MNKSILALAVAGALAASAAAQAETTLYGSARISTVYTQPNNYNAKNANNTTKDKSNWDVANEASRIGVKGSEDLGGGLKAIYQYEFGVNIDGGSNSFTDSSGDTGTDGSPLNRRLSSVGLTGGFGTVVLGRVWSAPYLYVGSLTDVFNSSASGGSGTMGWDRLNSTVGLALTSANPGGDRVPDVVAYITPNFAGFSAAAAVVMNGGGTNCDVSVTKANNASCVGANRGANREDIDAYDIAGGYTLGGLTLGASYRDYIALDYTQWTVGAAYKFPFGLRLAGTYSSRDTDGNYANPNAGIAGGPATVGAYDPSVWEFVAEYTFGASTIRAGYSVLDHDGQKVNKNDLPISATNPATNWEDTEAWRVGYQYDLSKRTRLWAEYLSESNIFLGDGNYSDRNFLSIGMRHDF